eukprot:scaffold17752_cov80-Skeletonema_marinoi.AAC.4
MALFETISAPPPRRRGHQSSPPAYTDDSAALTNSSNSDEHEHHKSNSPLTYSQTASCKSILMIGAALMLFTFPLAQKNFRSHFYLRPQSQHDSSDIQTQLTKAITTAAAATEEATTISVKSSQPLPTKVILHVGPHKTGSTAIQTSLQLDLYHKSLASDNYMLLPGDQGYSMKKALSRCLNFSGKKCPTDIMKQMKKARSNSHNILISSEQFDYYRPMKQIQAFFKHFDSIQIVVVYRRFSEWLASWYGQDRRNHWKDWNPSSSMNFVDIVTKKGVRGWYKNDRYSINAYNHYNEYFNVSWLSMHANKGDFRSKCTEYVQCQCRSQENTKCQSDEKSEIQHCSNDEMAYDEIVTEAYDRGLINGTAITRNDARRFLYKYQQNHMQLGEGKEAAYNEFPKICLPEETLEELLTVSLEAEREYYSSFLQHSNATAQTQGEEELRHKFEKMKSGNAFCSIDTRSVLADPKWRKAFNEMNKKGNENDE